jgi:hypothetical protein
MEEAIPLLTLLGVVIVALMLLLIGLAAWFRSRKRPEQASPVAAVPAAALPVEPDQSPSPEPEPVQVYLQADGKTFVQVGGRRFARLSDIESERLAQQARAAVEAMQRFADMTPASPAELKDELRLGHLGDGSFVVEFGGQRYRSLMDIRDGQVGRQLLALIGELNGFAKDAGVPASVVSSGEPYDHSQDLLRSLATQPAAAPAPLKMPGLFDSLRRPTPKAAPVPVGLAAQIESVLQQQLLDDPVLVGRSIHFITATDGSLALEVDGRVLAWPDEVKEPQVREAVQRAVRLWEKST